MTMYKLLHSVLGHDYVAWSNGADQGIARVWTDGMGRACYWRYRSIKVCDIINKPSDVIWLTCEPQKYMDHLPTAVKAPNV